MSKSAPSSPTQNKHFTTITMSASASSSPNQNNEITMSMSAPSSSSNQNKASSSQTPIPTQRKEDHLVIDIPSSHPAFSVNNIRNSIPILLTRRSDYAQYASWVELFRIHANLYNLLHHIEDAHTPSTVDEKRLDDIVKQWIYATISQDLLQAIMKPGVSAKQLWARLQGIFQHMQRSHRMSLRSNFESTRLEDFPSMQLYCQRLEELSTQLTNSGDTDHEEIMVYRLISGLTKGKYDAIVKEIEQARPRLSYDEARSRLLSEETRFMRGEFRVEQHSNRIYKAALGNDWNSVSEIFESNQELMTKAVTSRGETPLMLAVGTNRSHHFVQSLLDKLELADLKAKSLEGNTALHYAAKVGNLIDAKRLVAKGPIFLPIYMNKEGKKAVMLAASLGRKDMLLYLLGVTELHVDDTIGLIPLTIEAGFIDVASLLLSSCHQPQLQLEFYKEAVAVLDVLAKKAELFRSESSLGFWSNLIYNYLIHVDQIKLKEKILISASLVQGEDHRRVIIPSSALENITVSPTGVWRILQYIALPIKNIYDIKVKHVQTSLIVEDVCSVITHKFDHENASKIYESTIANTIRYGASELVEQCISTMPFDLEETSLFHLAIQHRRQKIFNLVIQTTSHKAFVACFVDEKKKENALHVAAKLAPPDRLNTITGAALQMQRELQWYKEVESFLGPSAREALNVDEKTPEMIFTDEHKALLKESREWMKDTSTSCTVVAALIITIAFAAIFTVPGGYKDDDGKPKFLNNKVFMLFIISGAIGIFSSSTSILMFLGILTSRYAEEDFLYALPIRMTIGIVALFLSLAATVVTFSLTLTLAVQDKVTWVAAPLAIMTSIHVCLFVLLQFPLLVELVNSTYGPSIFCKHSKRNIDYVQVK